MRQHVQVARQDEAQRRSRVCEVPKVESKVDVSAERGSLFHSNCASQARHRRRHERMHRDMLAVAKPGLPSDPTESRQIQDFAIAGRQCLPRRSFLTACRQLAAGESAQSNVDALLRPFATATRAEQQTCKTTAAECARCAHQAVRLQRRCSLRPPKEALGLIKHVCKHKRTNRRRQRKRTESSREKRR